MRKLSVIFLMIAVVMLFAAAAFTADEAKEADKAANEYVGPKKCKMCHKDVYAAWETTPHAKTFDVLSAEEQKKAECVGCHMTGTDAKGVAINNVTCEACHSAGSAYKSPKIMSKKKWAADPEAHKKMALDAGLVYPTAETCVGCHKEEGNPNFKAFDFEKMKGKVHPVAAAE